MNKNNEISKETIDHISKLALIDLSEEEKERLSKELGSILNYFKKLDELDTDKVKPTTHPIDGLKNVFREDVPWESLSNEEALRNAKNKKDGFFKAPRILKE
ncbi:MAG: Asp-tRNA(Asn)/Glu-tRNA(Gln) amidotransferase subunit GatC [Candidatus Thorarchaeota archaeon]